MNKFLGKNNKIFIIVVGIIGLILIARNFLFSKNNEITKPSHIELSKNSQTTVDNTIKKDENITRENIEVKNNSLEYDLKVNLVKKDTNYISMEYQFYNEGAVIKKEISSEKLPEVAISNANPIANVYLNYNFSKAYFIIRSKDLTSNSTADNTQETNTLYSISFKDFSVSKLMTHAGKISEPYFSKNMKYMVFNLSNDTQKDASFVNIFNCENNDLLINKNTNAKNLAMGNKPISDKKYGYSFINWHLGNVINLKETILSTQNNNSQPISQSQIEVLYDIEKNVFVNIDGSVIDENTTKASINTSNTTKNAEQKSTITSKPESTQIQTLRNLESYLTSKNFSAAYKLFEDEFWMNAFGFKSSAPVKKSDLTEETFTIAYGDTLKSTKIKKIVGEKIEGDTAIVYFYILYAPQKGAELVEYPISVRMHRAGTGWKVFELRDEDASKPPFSN